MNDMQQCVECLAGRTDIHHNGMCTDCIDAMEAKAKEKEEDDWYDDYLDD